jgi:chaperonin GroES
MLSNCNVLGTRIAVELPQKKTQTAGGIVLPGQSAEMPNTGVVIRAGIKSTYDMFRGDVVIWSPYAAILGPLVIDGKEVWFVDESDILIVKTDVKTEKGNVC